jgi:hypothetical protein
LDNSIAFYIARNLVRTRDDVKKLDSIVEVVRRGLALGYVAVYAPVASARLAIEQLLCLRVPRLGPVLEELIEDSVEKRTPEQLRELREPLLSIACALESVSPDVEKSIEKLVKSGRRMNDVRFAAGLPATGGKAKVLEVIALWFCTRGRWTGLAERVLRQLSAMPASKTRDAALTSVLHLFMITGARVRRSRWPILEAIAGMASPEDRVRLYLRAQRESAPEQIRDVARGWAVIMGISLVPALVGAITLVVLLAGGGRNLALICTCLALAALMALPYWTIWFARRAVARSRRARREFIERLLTEVKNYRLLTGDDTKRDLLRFAIRHGGEGTVVDTLMALPPERRIEGADLAFSKGSSSSSYRLLVDSARVEDIAGAGVSADAAPAHPESPRPPEEHTGSVRGNAVDINKVIALVDAKRRTKKQHNSSQG